MPLRRAGIPRNLALGLALFFIGMPVCVAGLCNPPDQGFGSLPPSPPWFDQDIGSMGGCAEYNSSSGTFTVKSVGGFIPLTTSDSLHFAYRAFTGDFEFIARLTGLGAGTQDNFAGLMVRESGASSSRHATLMYTNRSGQFAGESVTARWRAFTAERVLEGAYRLTEIPGIPHYQKLVRYQDQITFYESTDGIDWKWVEGTTLAGLATNLNVGLAVWSRDGSLVDGTFDNVSLNALTLPYTTSWVGNSLPGGGSHVPQDVLAMYVDPTNGNLYTNTIWDEGGAEVSVFDTNGKYVRSMDDTHNHGGGHAVTSNGNYVYAAMTLQPYYVVRRYNLNGTPAPWSGGGGPDGSMLIVPDVLNPTTDHLRGLAINRRTGGAYTNRLYVSDPAAGMVRIYQENTDNTIHWITSFPLARPRAIAINPVDDTVWVIQADDPSLSGNQSAVLHFTPTGGALPHDTIPPKKGSTINFGVPTALTVRSDGKVWVADDGPNQQIRIFSSTGILSSTFGDAGGIYSIAGMSKKGEVRPTKFNGPTGIGLDNNGNIYVACDGVEVQGGGTAGSVEGGTGTELRKFDAATHNLLWEKYGLAFVDTTDVDPATDGLDLFDRQRHYEMDYSQPAGQQWKYKGLTLDRFSYPNDGRLHQLETSLGPAIVRRLPPGDNAKRILFLTTQYGGFLAIYRFDPNSEIAIPSGLLMSANPGGAWPPNRLPGTRSIWRDFGSGDPMKDGNGNMDAGEYTPDGPAQPAISNWSVDDNGDIWSASPAGAPAIRHYLFKGLDSKGNPVYYGTNNAPCPNPGPDPPRCVEEFQTPSEFGAPSSYCNATGDPCTGVMRAYYVPSSHTMYLSGFPPTLPKLPAEDQYTTLGREIARYDNWDQNCPTGTERSCAPVWSITDLPYQMTSPYDNVARSMDLTCGRLLVGIQAVAPDQFFPEVRVYDTANGALLDRRRPGPEVAGKSGQNINPAGMNAFQRSNGEILVFMEELLNAKTLMYRVTAPPCGP